MMYNIHLQFIVSENLEIETISCEKCLQAIWKLRPFLSTVLKTIQTMRFLMHDSLLAHCEISVDPKVRNVQIEFFCAGNKLPG